jgi:hypothetical protein
VDFSLGTTSPPLDNSFLLLSHHRLQRLTQCKRRRIVLEIGLGGLVDSGGARPSSL